jgi:hypothetical protein
MPASPRKPDRTPTKYLEAQGAATPGTPVNPVSRAVSPRKQYPFHFDLLMRDLFACGIQPEKWMVIAGEELRLDEDGMDIEFTLIEVATNQVRRSRVDVQHGKLVRITHI